MALLRSPTRCSPIESCDRLRAQVEFYRDPVTGALTSSLPLPVAPDKECGVCAWCQKLPGAIHHPGPASTPTALLQAESGWGLLPKNDKQQQSQVREPLLPVPSLSVNEFRVSPCCPSSPPAWRGGSHQPSSGSRSLSLSLQVYSLAGRLQRLRS